MVASAHPVAAVIGPTHPPARRQRLRRGDRRRGGRGRAAADDVRPRRRRVRRRSTTPASARSSASTAAASRRPARRASYYASRGLKKMPLEGVHSVGVPGAVAVYEAIWKRYGTHALGGALGAGDQAGRGRRRDHRAGSARGSPSAPRCSRASRTRRAQFLPDGRAPAAGRALGGARTWREACGPWPRAAPRRSTAASSPSGCSTSSSREGALFEPDDFARQQAERLHADRHRLPRPARSTRPRRRRRASCCSSSSTSSRDSTWAGSIRSAPTASTCWSRRRSWPSRTGTATRAIPRSSTGRSSS